MSATDFEFLHGRFEQSLKRGSIEAGMTQGQHTVEAGMASNTWSIEAGIGAVRASTSKTQKGGARHRCLDSCLPQEGSGGRRPLYISDIGEIYM